MPGLFRTRPRNAGEPRSANGASSFHLRWVLEPVVPLVEVSAVLEVVEPPAVQRLYFWALQVSFVDDGGAESGGAHIGLQWNARHPGGRAVNWGGYGQGGGLLAGSPSPLPSAPDDPNTRDYPWQARRPYELRVAPTPGKPEWWRGIVTDLTDGRATVIRDLHGGGSRLARPLVWSEVFARCDHPSVRVRWSGLSALTGAGGPVSPGALALSYEHREAGGCDNTTVVADGDGVLQVTNAPRAPGRLLAFE